MDTQLIISPTDFFLKYNFRSEEEKITYILDYFDLSTLFFRNLNVYYYRKCLVFSPIIGNDLVKDINLYATIRSMRYNFPFKSLCFDLGLKRSIFSKAQICVIEKNISNYIGVIYENH